MLTRVADMTIEELTELVQKTIQQAVRDAFAEREGSPTLPIVLDDFPVDDLGDWPESLTLRREDLYGD